MVMETLTKNKLSKMQSIFEILYCSKEYISKNFFILSILTFLPCLLVINSGLRKMN